MKSARRAYTLIEMLIALTMLAAIWTTIALALHTLYRADRRMHDELSRANSLDRFAAQLRFDAHQARAARLVDGPAGTSTLVLDSGTPQTIAYRLAADEIQRVVTSGDTLKHRESFSLAGLKQADWKLAADTAPTVTLRVELSRGHDQPNETHTIMAAWNIVAVPRANQDKEAR